MALKGHIPWNKGKKGVYNLKSINNARITKFKSFGYPEAIIDMLILNKFLDWKQHLLLIKNNIFTKKLVKVNCQKCNKEITALSVDLTRRKYDAEVPLCQYCALVNSTNKPDWKQANSDAQLIAQNKPETLKKNAASVSKFWAENLDVKERVRQKLIHLFETDNEHRLKVQRSKYKGKIETKFGLLHFDSKLELFYLLQCESNPEIKTITRWNKPGIKYTLEGQEKRYYPDYIVNDDTIVELKGDYYFKIKADEINAKADACIEQYSNMRYCLLTNYDVVYQKSLQYLAKIAKRKIDFFYESVRKEYEVYLNEIKK